MTAIPPDEILQRIQKLQAQLSASDPSVDLAIVLDQVNQYYLSGTIQSAHLLVPAQGEATLLVRKVLERAQEESPIENIKPFLSLKGLSAEMELVAGPRPWRIGIELDVLPAKTFSLYQKILGESVEFVDISPTIAQLRSVKSSWELEQIRTSAQINQKLYDAMPEILSPELSTYELQSVLNCRACLFGHIGLVRMRGFNVDGLIGVVASGPTGAEPGHSAFPIGGLGPHPSIAHGGDFNKIHVHTPVIFDYLANQNGYHHDQTRMAVIGKMNAEAMKIFDGMQGLLRAVEARLKPGKAPSEIYEEVLALAEERGLAEGFMGRPDYKVPFIGHAIGLEVNETPVLAKKFDAPLVEGNVLAVEPKFTHPEFGVIGLENTYAITKDGFENLGSASEDVVQVKP